MSSDVGQPLRTGNRTQDTGNALPVTAMFARLRYTKNPQTEEEKKAAPKAQTEWTSVDFRGL